MEMRCVCWARRKENKKNCYAGEKSSLKLTEYMNSCIQAQSETKQRTHMYTHTIWQCNKNRKNVYVFFMFIYIVLCAVPYSWVHFPSTVSLFRQFRCCCSIRLLVAFSVFRFLSLSLSRNEFSICVFCLRPPQRRFESFVSLFYVQCIQATFSSM